MLLELVNSGGNLHREMEKFKVTFHDPCFLGRHNGIYDQSKEIIEAIAGFELVELEKKMNAICCGREGGNYF